MNSVGAIKAMDQDEQQLQTVISDILTTALRDTVYPVDFSIYSTCPRAEVEPLDLPVIYPVHYDSLAVSVGSSEKMPAPASMAVFCFLFSVFLCPRTLVIAHRTRFETLCTVFSPKKQTDTSHCSRPPLCLWNSPFLQLSVQNSTPHFPCLRWEFVLFPLMIFESKKNSLLRSLFSGQPILSILLQFLVSITH